MGEREGDDVNVVQRRLEQIKRSHRSRIRWQITAHTAELAIAAIGGGERPERRRPGGKARRRKRHKRLL